MLHDIGHLNHETDTTMGKIMAATTATMLLISESIPNYMELTQMFAWCGTGIAGFATAGFYVYRVIKKKF